MGQVTTLADPLERLKAIVAETSVARDNADNEGSAKGESAFGGKVGISACSDVGAPDFG